jgi:anaerobic dimethyl sulfoxide reductase subunit C (anchor subunit)
VKERSLAAFTLLSQMAVGAFWVLGALHLWVARQAGPATAETWTRIALWVVVPVMMAAMLASLLHLGTPLYAWRALANLSSSWLSREILFAVLFTAAAATLAVLCWFNLGPPGARTVLGWAATLLGLALIYSMANAYRLRTIPAWDTWLTLVSFLVAALLLGALAVGVVLAVTADVSFELLRSPLQWIALGSIVLLTVELVGTAFWFARLVAGQGAALRAAGKIMQEHRWIFGLRLALAAAGVVAAGVALALWSQAIHHGLPVIVVFGLVFASEVLGRLLFYEARVRHGV